ncbi:MAG: HEAT repeat domain-containing protein [Pseudomonadota bacterium]|nr:HEAT repeat domain-containing protein [Pseudomonadota bacterium]MDP1903007.1 HEAT repeat domain-containing protein [Pseudomonadota bacterium]MDP2352221.1 HEAT repeat domain-containing protein [Pseudomonadota bacterium]
MTADALLFISRHCPHCPAVLAGLSDLVKHGGIGRLDVVNIEIHPEVAESHAVRSVPWLRLGPFELAGVRTPGELAIWARRASEPDGMAEAFHDLLKSGGLDQVLALVAADTTRLAALLPIVGNPEASINVRLGAGVAFEEYAGAAPLRALVPALGVLSEHADPRVRADACHYLGLSGEISARPWLEARLTDLDPDVREIARDGMPEARAL